jgi:hypothetical protein
MSFTLKTTDELEGNASFKNEKGNHECVEFVQKSTGATKTATWKKGINVMEAVAGSISKGTAIATFDTQGKYPLETGKRHAAVYISHSSDGIKVYDQWNGQAMVKSRTIHSDLKLFRKYVNRAENYFVVETE